MQLNDLLDVGLLGDMITEGYVSQRNHNTKPLAIFNYTPRTQYEWKWNEVTLKTRGLIVNTETYEVVARPFEKFFNWDQGIGKETWQNRMPPAGPAIRMEKMDGSLGILYAINWSNGGNPCEEGIATRGSFHSEQAEWATGWYLNTVNDQIHSGDRVFCPQKGKTYLFEIVYPENRVVVDYGGYKGLILLDVIDTETGETNLQEFDWCAWPDKVKRIILFNGFDSGQAADIPPGDEGFVYLWPTKNFRAKMKSAEYIELHRLLSHLSEKTIWEALVAGKTVGEIKVGIPDEFYGFIDETADKIMTNARRIVSEAHRAFYQVAEGVPRDETGKVIRKDFALKASKHPLKKYLFMILDSKPVYPVALLESKPVVNRSLVSQEDI